MGALSKSISTNVPMIAAHASPFVPRRPSPGSREVPSPLTSDAASFAPRASRPVRMMPSRKPATIAWPCAAVKTLSRSSRATNRSVSPPHSIKQLRNSSAARSDLRQVSAGGCGACEADTNVLGTIGWDLSRFGIQFVASPRHADGLLITGCVSRNMELALKKAWDAVPEPRIVIAVGACAIAGGPFINHPQVLNGAASVVPVDLYIPGCPPHPLTILTDCCVFSIASENLEGNRSQRPSRPRPHSRQGSWARTPTPRCRP